MMKIQTVLVDVTIDQGGCMKTSLPTTHHKPTYVVDGVVHYSRRIYLELCPKPQQLHRQMPHNPMRSIPFTLHIANHGWNKACNKYSDLIPGLNIVSGQVVFPAVAHAFNLPEVDVKSIL